MVKYLEIIVDYIQRPKTNYALMINGDWGNGKTYFLQNTVFPYLQELEKKPIYISLNGINTVDEVSKQIYFSTSFLNKEWLERARESRTAKHVTQIAKVAHNVASMFGVSGSADNSINYEELIKLNDKIVLCFDDLERCKIDVVEILGYINSFVEHDDVKTIIVGNEKEIKDINIDQNNELKVLASTLSLGIQQKHEKIDIKAQINALFNGQKQFDVVKEKLVGKTIFFEPDFSYIISEMIRDYKDTNANYYEFMQKNKDVISTIHEVSERRNLRIIKHSLSDFLKIFTSLDKALNKTPHFDRLIKSYFFSALILSIEHKEGNISTGELSNMLSTTITRSFLMISKNDSTIYDKYLNALNKKVEYHQSEYISSYIATSILDEKKLLYYSEKQLNDWAEQERSGEGKSSLKKLTEGFLELENDDFDNTVSEVIMKVKNGEYDLRTYARIFNYFEKFINYGLLNLSMEDLNEIFEEGIKKADFNHNDIDDNSHRFLISNPSENQTKTEILIKAKIENARNESMQKEIEDLIVLLPKDVEQFTESYSNSAKKPAFKAILQFVDIPEFYKKLKQLNNNDLQQVRFMFYDIYDSRNLDDFFKSDHENMNKLIACFKSDVDSLIGVRKVQYRLFIQNLEGFAESYKKIE